MVRKLSEEGIRVLWAREGCRLKAYKDSVGVWTIGYGHTSSAGPPHVHKDLVITQKEAEDIFRRDVGIFESAVRGAVKRPIAQHEYDAYVSFAYNVGGGAFARSHSVTRFNIGDKNGAADGLLNWMKPPEVASRRRGEFEQFKGLRTVARIDSAGRVV